MKVKWKKGKNCAELKEDCVWQTFKVFAKFVLLSLSLFIFFVGLLPILYLSSFSLKTLYSVALFHFSLLFVTNAPLSELYKTAIICACNDIHRYSVFLLGFCNYFSDWHCLKRSICFTAGFFLWDSKWE